MAPYHPASNGLAERAVRTIKQGLRKMTEGSLSAQIARFLFQYRNTPHSTTGMIPAELLMGRKLRSRLDLVRPSLQRHVQDKQEQQRRHHDLHAKQHTFVEGEKVYVKNHRAGDPWLPGEIIKATGPVSYTVKRADGNVVRSHQDHIRSRFTEVQSSLNPPIEDVDDLESQIAEESSLPDSDTLSPGLDELGTEMVGSGIIGHSPPDIRPSRDREPTADTTDTTPRLGRHHQEQQPPPVRIYPQRERRAPDYLGKT